MIGKLVNLIPIQYRFIAGVIAVLALLAVLGLIAYKIERHGYDRRDTELKNAVQGAKDEAQANLSKVEKAYAPRIKELQEAPDNDSVVGPLTTRAIDGL